VSNAVIINFPAMPDSIELARKANYVVYENFTAPDGSHHRYKGTTPLEIPFSFKVHAYDSSFCPQAGLTLLDIAAKLHSLTLPIGDSARLISATSAGEAFTPKQSAGDDAKGAASPNTGDTPTLNDKDADAVAFPVAAVLDLIKAGGQAPGVRCVGYVKDVSTKFGGPWICSPDFTLVNIPTTLEASFVFVHRPSHTNNFGTSQLSSSITQQNVQAYADDVKKSLYNTMDLALKVGNSYTGYKH